MAFIQSINLVSTVINRLYPFTVTVDGQQCATVTSMSSRSVSVTCSAGVMYGRVVRLTRKGSDQPLNLCEFQILGELLYD